MEYENETQKSPWQRLKDSPRTVSALIIILVVAAAIYAFSGTDRTQPLAPEATSAPTETLPEEQEETENVKQQAQPTELPQEQKTDKGFQQTTQAGEGMTHLARRAAANWLAENRASYEVTKEHRIYIEDYIQKKMGSPRLEVGEQQTVSFDLIQEAVEAAGKLSEKQLKNLTQYTYVL